MLNGKKAIVTGANRNIGASIATLLASKGAEVVISYRSDQAGAEAVAQGIQKAGGSVHVIQSDFSSLEAVEVFYKKALALLGQVDILINNAGAYDTKGILELEISTLEQVLQIGVIASTYLTQMVAKQMVAKHIEGSIINVSSISGFKPWKNRIAHGSAKAALIMLTKNMALDLADHNIRVNAIAPGSTPYEGESWGIEGIPLASEGLPEYQAKAVEYLLSEGACWVTGQVLTVDGGHSL